MYGDVVPKLWDETIEEHRRQVREAVLDTTAELVFEHGLRAVTMSQVAEQTGIGRATLYKYFPDVDTILHAWHARQIGAHLNQLAEIRDGAGNASERLTAVLAAYAHIAQQTRSHDTELVKFLHPGAQIADAHRQLLELVEQLVSDGVRSGDLRDDIPPDELANYCLHALDGAAELTTDAAVSRLLGLIAATLQPAVAPTA